MTIWRFGRVLPGPACFLVARRAIHVSTQCTRTYPPSLPFPDCERSAARCMTPRVLSVRLDLSPPVALTLALPSCYTRPDQLFVITRVMGKLVSQSEWMDERTDRRREVISLPRDLSFSHRTPPMPAHVLTLRILYGRERRFVRFRGSDYVVGE